MRSNIGLTIALALAMAASSTFAAAPADEQYADAAHHYAQQRYDAAIGAFEQFVAEHDSHVRAAEARFFLAESLLQTGKSTEAAQAFEAFLSAHPQHRFAAQASFRIGESAYLRGDFLAALPKLQAFVAAHGSHNLCEYALPYLADCQLEQGDTKSAQKSYQLALKSYPSGALAGECRLGLGRIAEIQGNDGEARRFYEFLAIRGDSPAAIEAQLRLGQLLYHQRDYQAAAEQLRALADASEKSATRTTARYWLGFVLLEQKERDAARQLWTTAIEEDTTHALAPALALALAEMQATGGDRPSAQAWCQRIARDWPTSAYADDALALETQLALGEQRFEEVAKLAQQFSQQHPKSHLHAVVQEHLGRALLAEGKATEAIAVLQPLARDASPQQAHLPYTLALAQLSAKQFANALLTLDEIQPEHTTAEIRAGVLVAKGSALVALGRGGEAVAPLKQYLKDHGQGGDIAKCRAQLCIALAQAKQFQEAQVAWKTYQLQHAEDRALVPTTLYLAEAAAEHGEYAAAQAWFEFLASDDRPEEIRERAIAGLAWLAEREPTSDKTSERLAQLEQQSPQSSQAAAIALRRAQNLEASGQLENALATYLAVAKEHPAAPQTSDALFGAARIHDELSQDREALEILQRLLNEQPKYERRDAVHYQTAWVLIDLKKRDEAAKHFQTLHEEHRESTYWADATYRLAEYYVQQKRHTDASPLLGKLIAANPGDELMATALYLQAQSATTEQRWADVAPPLLQLIEKFPQHKLRLLAEYWLAEADYRTGKLDAAGQRLADLSVKLEGQDEAWLPLVPLRQSQVLAHQQRWQEAFAIAKTIGEKHPNFRQQYEVDYLLGRCLGAMAKFDAARAAYERVVQSPIGGGTETAAMAQWMIGETYFQQERYDDAIAAYHRCERLFAFERWQAAALLQAGKCHEAKGTYRDAIGLYAQLLKQYSNTTYAHDASQRMRVAQQRAGESKQR